MVQLISATRCATEHHRTLHVAFYHGSSQKSCLSSSRFYFALALVTTSVACSPAAPQTTATPAEGDGVVAVAIPEPTAAEPRKTQVVAEPADDTTALLLNPTLPQASAPPEFRVRFETTKGNFDVRCVREWAPHGVDRFYHLVRIGFFRDVAVFRMVEGFVAQFGIHGSPAVSAAWKNAELTVDDVKRSNTAGTLTYAMASQPTSRTTQVFVNLTDNSRLDKMGFAPICEVVGTGLDTVNRFFAGYKEKASREQSRIQKEGNTFLRTEFPDLDYIVDAQVLDAR